MSTRKSISLNNRYVRMLGIKCAAAVLLFLSQIMPAWCLSIEQFGVFSYLNSVLVVLSFLVLWGTDRLCLKEVAILTDADKSKNADVANAPPVATSLKKSPRLAHETETYATDDVDVGATLFGAYAIVVINTLVAGVCLLAWLPGKLASGYTWVIGLAAVLVLFSRAIAQLSNSVTRGLHRVIVAESALNLLRPIFFILPLAVIYFSGRTISLAGTLFLFAVSFGIAAVACTILNRQGSPVLQVPTVAKVSWVYRHSFYFLMISVGLPLMANINTIQLGNMRPESEVALFATAAKIVSLVLLGLVSANLLIAPKLSPMFYQDNISGMRKLIRSNNLFVAVLTSVPILVIVFFASPILSVFGTKYSAAAPLLQALMIGNAVSVFCGPVVLTTTMTGLQRLASIVILGSCFINWLICLWLIPHYGAMGAVVASVVANILLNAVLAAVIYQRIGLNVTMLNLIR